MRGFIRITIAALVPRRGVSNTRHVNTRKSRTSDVQDYKRQPPLTDCILESSPHYDFSGTLPRFNRGAAKKMRHFLPSQWISRKTRDLLAITSQLRQVVS